MNAASSCDPYSSRLPPAIPTRCPCAGSGSRSFYGFSEFARSGGLMAYGPSVPDQARRAATYVDQILRGTKPADLPVQQPTTYELIINLKAAKTLGLTIPHTLLLQTDQVIE